MMVILIVLLHQITLHSIITSTVHEKHCVVVKNDVFDNCTHKQKQYNQLYKGLKADAFKCSKQTRCRHMKLTVIRRQLYGAKIFNAFDKMLRECCGPCASYEVKKTIYRIDQITKPSMPQSDIIFPVFAVKSAKEIYSYHFIPVLDAPTAYYLTLSHTRLEKITQLILGCLRTWPLIVICLLLSCISGFIVWITERKVNGEEFPKRFHEGIYQGFWWSFVSMTTVGYGDKAPRSCAGRIVAVFWILTGITIFAILTGSLTNQITSIVSPPTPQLKGKRVGGLRHKIHDSIMVAQHGGFLVDFEHNSTIVAIVDLIEKLQRKEIEGLLLTKPYYNLFSLLINYKRYKNDKIRIKDVEWDITEKEFVGEKLSIGMLVKNYETYDYFRKYFEDNWLHIQNCNLFNLNYKEKVYAPETLDSRFGVELSYNFLFGIFGVLGMICCVGFMREIRRRYGKKGRKRMEHERVAREKKLSELYDLYDG